MERITSHADHTGWRRKAQKRLRRTERRLKREDVCWRSLLAGPGGDGLGILARNMPGRPANPDAAARMQRISLEIEPPLAVEDLKPLHYGTTLKVASTLPAQRRGMRRSRRVQASEAPTAAAEAILHVRGPDTWFAPHSHGKLYRFNFTSTSDSIAGTSSNMLQTVTLRSVHIFGIWLGGPNSVPADAA